jgi:heme-degrading monooxygenase HmoA
VFVYLWEFTVTAERRAEFERAYGDDGDWVALFRRSPDYLGTDLLRDRGQPGRYLTVDRWRSAAACEAFRELHAAEMAAIDARCVELTLDERHLGDFDRAG